MENSEANDVSSIERTYSFNEYSLVFESAERVTDRRISLNRSNYAICLGMIIGDAVVVNWAIGNTEFFNFAMLIISVIGVLGTIFSVGWTKQIADLKNLNSAKFQVMAEMSEQVRFESDYKNSPISYMPFKREWEILNEKENALTEYGFGKALSGTNVEFILPRAYILIFVSTSILSAYFLKSGMPI